MGLAVAGPGGPKVPKLQVGEEGGDGGRKEGRRPFLSRLVPLQEKGGRAGCSQCTPADGNDDPCLVDDHYPLLLTLDPIHSP